MSFAWETSPDLHRGRIAHADALARELGDRAALFYRLGVPAADASARLAARIAWEFEGPAHGRGHAPRPGSLSDSAIRTLVADVYARRPGG
ncbi:MAG: hypothetical protein R2939_12355 [Kofleriaceae bacterium]